MDTRYKRWLQAIPVIGLIFGMGSVIGDAFLLWQFRLQLASPSYSDSVGWVVIEAVLLCGTGALVAYIFLKLTCASWFFLYHYRMTETSLTVIDPIFRRVTTLQFGEIRQLTNFFVHGPPPYTPASRGHILIDKSFHKIRLVEALPLWPDIAKRCISLALEKAANPTHF